MSADPKTAVENAARTLLATLAGFPTPLALRVADTDGRVACLIQVWDASGAIPTAGAERHRLLRRGRVKCRADIVELVRVAGRALTGKEVAQGLALAGKKHGPGVVARALVELMATGVLVNPKDKKGYRLAEWRKQNATRSLFD